MLTVTNVSKFYHKGSDKITALDDFSLEVAAGEYVGVRGQSGCGKTTLLLAVGGLLRPDQGTVTIEDQDLYQLSSEQRAHFRATNIGFVFQQFHLVPYLSVLDNVLAATLAHPLPDARNRANDLLDRFGLGHRLQHFPSELSTGERQRCALARALLHEPKLLLADEPTGNLDEANADIVLKHISEHAKNGGAVLLVTHDQRAVATAQRVVELGVKKSEAITTSP